MVQVTKIPDSGSLDSITVYWEDIGVGKGFVTIICYGSAWTSYFGAMSGDTIKEFFSRCGIDYLVNKLQCVQWQKQTKAHEKYLGRLCTAIKDELSKSVASDHGPADDGGCQDVSCFQGSDQR